MTTAYDAFDAACKRTPSLFTAGRAAEARHVLDAAAVAVCREVRDETCDLFQLAPTTVPEPGRWTA